MSKTSIVIPSRNERFLSNTVNDLFRNATGEIEVIAVCDGYWPDPPLADRKNLIILHTGQPIGMRAAINAAASIATGKYLMKTDGHCAFAKGFDEVLQADCWDANIVIPRRYSLDAEAWKRQRNRPIRDYHYLCYPDPHKPHDGGMHGIEWPERSKERSDPQYDIDETPSFQGSCWFMRKTHFTDFLGGLSEDPIYGASGWAQEPTELGNKTWLGGGRVVVNKRTWYAHLHKGKAYGRGYKLDEGIPGHNYAARYWMENRWPERIHDIDWLVEKFWPMPTWPENWRQKWLEPTILA